MTKATEKQELRQASMSLPVELYDRLQLECGAGRVSAYLRGVLEVETRRLDLAADRLAGVVLSSDELTELAERASSTSPPYGFLEAVQVLADAEKIGRHIEVAK